MDKNISISLGNHFESFIENCIHQGRYSNASEVVRAGLRLLEEEEEKLANLKKAVQEGLDSGIAKSFDPNKHLTSLKKRRKNG
jgi:antitoxin ParD1/3/4